MRNHRNSADCFGLSPSFEDTMALHIMRDKTAGSAVAGLVGIECDVVSGVINLESSGVEASDWRLRHDEHYHEARFLAA